MPTYTQANRLLAVSTPLGADALLLEAFSGTEAVSEPFRFDLDLLADANTDVAFDQILGQPVTVTVLQGDGEKRFFNGIVNRFSQGSQVRGTQGNNTFVRYRATVVPKLWLLTRVHRSRIFQQVGVDAILKQVLTGLDVKWDLQGKYEPRDYCVQYRETDFDFASRLMEEEGIYYYFAHADGAHQMVVGDHPGAHQPVPNAATVKFDEVGGGMRPDDRITSWLKTQEIRSGKETLWDHCFELVQPPGFQTLESKKTIQESVAVGTVTHKLKVAGNDKLELYDYPGGFAQRFDGIAPGGGDRKADVDKIKPDGTRTAGLRMQQEAARGLEVNGESHARQLTAGHKFTLANHYHGNGDYVLTRVEHRATVGGAYTGTGGGFGEGYGNTFNCIPAALPFRPAPVTPKAHVLGTQTATVVGPSGEEIFTDKYSRVKVQFHWDREGKKDANSSCWVRVATYWAGKQWGAIHIPRIGQEVVVAFEEGDPDRPIVVGSVYNAEQMPPYALPDNRTQSGIKSRSTLKGTPDHFNELRFEDKKGEEHIYFHAEKDFIRIVENNDLCKVGLTDHDKGDQDVFIHNDQAVEVGVKADTDKGPVLPTTGNQFVTVWNNRQLITGNGEADAADGSNLTYVWNNDELAVGNGESGCKDGSQLVSVWNNQEVAVGFGKGQNKDGSQLVSIWKNREVTLKTGNDTLAINKGNRTVSIDMGNDALTIKMGNQTTKLNLGASKTEAMQSITLKVGGSKVVIDQMGVTIEGMMVKINGQVMTDIKGVMTTVTGSAMAKLGGGITMIG